MDTVIVDTTKKEEFRRMAGTDSWLYTDKAAEREKLRARLASDTEAYIAAGGEIARCGTRIGEPPRVTDAWYQAGRLEVDPVTGVRRRVSSDQKPKPPRC